MGIIRKQFEAIDLWRYEPEINPDGSEKHIVCEGARYHVISYSSKGKICSEPNCEINKTQHLQTDHLQVEA